ncbi:MAG: sigma 54-interacting transcriptional regulator [Polyangiaceae bacterium]
MASADTQTKTLPRDAPFTRRCPRLAWNDSAGAHSIVVDRAMVVGSAANADVVVDDATVSRLHAELEPRQDGVWVRDLGSLNGTFVGDVLVTAARLPASARVRVGATVLTVLPDMEETAVDLWPEDGLGDLIGGSPAMRELYATIVRVGATEAAVLVRGETGSGKELVARAIHDCSHRAGKPFVVVDCAALPEGLLEAELFGHTRGAFTGAIAARAGSFEAAEGGTVFLDEIGELPLATQPKLLRVLESRVVRRVGETSHRPIQARFIAATHRDLRRMVNDGHFREDLYFRIAVLPVRVPPLRERPEDIPRLVARFAPTMPEAAQAELCEQLRGRRLAGNVRELRNIVERAVLRGGAHLDDLGDASSAEAESAQASLEGELSFESPFHEFQRAAEREYLRRLLVKHGGQVADAAEASGVNRTYFYRLLKKHAL